MNSYVSKKVTWISVICLVFFILDRVLKYLALAGKISWHKNFGIAFSINIPSTLLPYYLITLLFILIFIVYQLIKSIQNNYRLQVAGYGLLMVGVISNLIDRMKFGYIIDYINFGFFYNNLADVVVCIGLGVLVLHLIIKQT